jgi:Flp pilus assembly protein TadG
MRGHRSRGQSLAEFAMVFPIFMLVLGAIIQFGLIFWAQNTLTQVARDTGRWAATQTFPCGTAAEEAAAAPTVIAMANTIANNSSLFGKTAAWTATNVVVNWTIEAGTACPPTDNQGVAWIDVELHHTIPTFFPFVPGGGALATGTRFRLEPMP